MARRTLLTGDERHRLFDPPVTDREVARYYTLSPDDLKWIEARHGPSNQLGAAVQMALLRHPGFPDNGSRVNGGSTNLGGVLINALAPWLRIWSPTIMGKIGGQPNRLIGDLDIGVPNDVNINGIVYD